MYGMGDIIAEQREEIEVLHAENVTLRTSKAYNLNEQIALRFGWRPEEDFHPKGEEWGGWRDPNGEAGIVLPPDFLLFLDHMFPALESYLAAGGER